jgi:hypothetical protein
MVGIYDGIVIDIFQILHVAADKFAFDKHLHFLGRSVRKHVKTIHDMRRIHHQNDVPYRAECINQLGKLGKQAFLVVNHAVDDRAVRHGNRRFFNYVHCPCFIVKACVYYCYKFG